MSNAWKSCAVVLGAGFALALSVPHAVQAQDEATPAAQLPQGAYKLDKTHASITFRVNHMGMSNYTARFKRFDADLFLDPKAPAASTVNATIDPRSIETDFPLPTPDFNGALAGEKWLDAVRYKDITFRSKDIVITGPNRAKVTGDFYLHGVTKPVVLDTVFNDGFASSPLEPTRARIGFSARTKLKRSDFGIDYALPQPGSKLGVGDEVEVIIEAEFTQEATPK